MRTVLIGRQNALKSMMKSDLSLLSMDRVRLSRSKMGVTDSVPIVSFHMPEEE